MTVVTDTASHLDYPLADTQSWLEPSPTPSRRHGDVQQPPGYHGNPALDQTDGTYSVVTREGAAGGDEYETEAITKIKFKRVSVKRNQGKGERSRSPSPEPGSHRGHEKDVVKVSQANGYLAPPGDDKSKSASDD